MAEIIGPAGSGKTTLSRLLQNGTSVRAGLSVWQLPLSLLLQSALSSTPDLVRLSLQRRSDWEDFKLVIQHNALLRLVRRERRKGSHAALLLDEGNLFALARLREFGGNGSVEDDREGWLQKLIDGVAPELDAVIWLDASDSVLAKRIREREKWHRVKDKSDAEIEEHLSRYRRSFDHVLKELGKRTTRPLQVYRFSTEQLSMDQIAASILTHAGVGA